VGAGERADDLHGPCPREVSLPPGRRESQAPAG
jgi:hypothetical protein